MVPEPFQEELFMDESIGLKAYMIIDTPGSLDVATGGIRMGLDVTESEIKHLARSMTHKLVLIGSHFGGAKSGIVADPKDVVKKKQFLQRFAELSRSFLQTKYLPGTDIGVSYEDIPFIYESAGIDPLIIFKNKSRELNLNLRDRFSIKNIPDIVKRDVLCENDLQKVIGGLGVSEATEEACAFLGIPLNNTRIAIQGFGKIGKFAAKYLFDKGAAIVAVADKEGTIINENGLPVYSLISATDCLGYIDRPSLRFDFKESKDPDAWLEVGSEIIIPAAVKNAINASNMQKIKSRLCVEAANVCVQDEAEKFFHQKGIFVVPDIIASAGTAGLTIAFNENLQNNLITEICMRIRYNVKRIFEESQKNRERPRTIALKMGKFL